MWLFQQQTWRKCESTLPPLVLSPSSREKGQVDDAICGLEADHKTLSLCSQKPSIITDPHTNANDQRVPERCAVRAAQSALLAHANHVAISCPENPCSVFIYLLWGVQGGTRPEFYRKTCEVYCTFLFGIWCVDAPHICDFITPYF